MIEFLRAHRTKLLGAALVAAIGAGAAIAQTGAPSDGANTQAREARQQERQAERTAEGEARLEGRIAFLKARLEITEAQTPLWDNFAATLRAQKEFDDDDFEDNGVRPTLPERLAREEAWLEERQQALQSSTAALIPLYDALSVEQRAIADRVIERDDSRFDLGDDDHDERHGRREHRGDEGRDS